MESIITNEVWKDIDGYGGQYQVSNLGRVKSLWRYHSVGVTSRRTKKIFEEKILIPTDNGNGYKIVGLQKDYKRKNFYVHRLVAEAFLENTNNYTYVNHKDYDRANNNFNNLEWCTAKENINYSRRNMCVPKTNSRVGISGEKCITYRKSNGTYRVVIGDKEYGSRKTLEEAILLRNKIAKEIGYSGINNLQ